MSQTETAEQTEDLVVETRLGPVRGRRTRGACRFRGIPYAAPPIGARRFAPPAPAEPWTQVRDGTGRFPVAPQPPDFMSQMLGVEGGPPQSEAECLTLHVWTPATDDAARPVMVWIHGGAFVSGSGTVPWYDGTNLTTRDVVVVTVNYRLGILGFLHLAELGGEAFAGSGNAGLLDQAAALAWVRDNIAAFGGDPDNVTIFGESAGGMSVGAQLALPASKGLFHRAIAQSGAAANVSTAERGTRIAARVLDDLAIDPSDVDQLRQVPLDRLQKVQEGVSADFGLVQGLPFQPVHDGDILPVDPLEAVANGAAAGIDLLVGTNRDELRIFSAMNPAMRPEDDETLTRRLRGFAGTRASEVVSRYRSLFPDATSADLFDAIGTDAVFRMPALRLAAAQQDHAATRVYEFHFPSRAFGGDMGATHALEVPYVFDNLDSPGAAFFTGEPDTTMRALAATMADAWCSFAHRGTPGASGLADWPTWEPPGHATMIFDEESRVVEDPAGAQLLAWGITD